VNILPNAVIRYVIFLKVFSLMYSTIRYWRFMISPKHAVCLYLEESVMRRARLVSQECGVSLSRLAQHALTREIGRWETFWNNELATEVPASIANSQK
jgi:hypothetical protein